MGIGTGRKTDGRTGRRPTFESVWASIDRLVAERREAEKERREAEAAMKEERREAEAARQKERREAEKERREAEAAMKEERRKTEEVMREERRKTEEVMREERRKSEESWRLLQEAQRKTEETVNKATGEFGNKWGRFLERLVEGDLAGLLRARGTAVDSVEPRVVAQDPKTLAKLAEYDLVATGADGAVVVEVKTKLWAQDVRRFLGKLAEFRDHFPEFAGKSVRGAVACMETRRKDPDGNVSPADPAELAEREGLLVIRAPGGDSGASVVVNPEGFKPKEF